MVKTQVDTSPCTECGLPVTGTLVGDPDKLLVSASMVHAQPECAAWRKLRESGLLEKVIALGCADGMADDPVSRTPGEVMVAARRSRAEA